MRVVLISTYELGRQPFGLASPAAWLAKRGHEVVCLDLSRQAMEEKAIRGAGLIGLYVPMHTAARLTMQLMEPLRRMNADGHFCVFGLYGPLNEEVFRKVGAQSVFGAEFEEELTELAERVASSAGKAGTQRSAQDHGDEIPRLKFEIPERSGLPALNQYAHLVLANGEHRTVGYTEASRGCKHLCRHCPIVPVYEGKFRVVQNEVVLADVRQQVKAGAQHLTFGDADFFNGVTHALRIAEALHAEFPELTYDATIKIEHLKKHKKHLATLRETGCLFVTSAVESLDDYVLEKLDKGHTRADFLEVLEDCRREGLALQPTFVPFTPWTTFENYRDLLQTMADYELVDAVAPIQLGIRLLIPAGSRLLELAEIREVCGPFDEEGLVHRWWHRDPRMDALTEEVQGIAAAAKKKKESRAESFEKIWEAAHGTSGSARMPQRLPILTDRAAVPYLNEPWYC